MENFEQVRRLVNKVTLAGKLAELSKLNEGSGKDGVPYLSFFGVLQVGEDKAQTVRFKVYIKSKKTNGEPSKTYASMLQWYHNAVPMTSNPDDCTMVEMIGSLTDNPYVNNAGVLIEDTTYSMQMVTDFREYKAKIDLEGYLEAINDEVSGEDQTPTGRKRVSIISRDIFGSTLRLRNIVIEKDSVRDILESPFEPGCTATFHIDLKLHQGESGLTSRGSMMFGDNKEARSTTGKSYLEKVWVGAKDLVEPGSCNELTSELVKRLLVERVTKLDSIKNVGYLGHNTTGQTSRSSFTANYGTQNSDKNSSEFMDASFDKDEMPF